MKKLIASLLLLFVLTGLILVHSAAMLRFGKRAEAAAEKAEQALRAESWDAVTENMRELEELWEKSRMWAALTIKTSVIEDIDISLKQSIAYAENKAKSDFIGEFIMLRKLLEHIPHQEGLHLDELL